MAKTGLTPKQVTMLQIAVKAAGIRMPKDDRRYRMLLGQYKKSDGTMVTTCKDLSNEQLGDILAICEANGWRCPGKAEDHFRKKTAESAKAASDGRISYAEIEAVKCLAGDLGWEKSQIAGMVKRVTKREFDAVAELSSGDAYKLIEALKNMVSRKTGNKYNNLKDVQSDMEVAQAVNV